MKVIKYGNCRIDVGLCNLRCPYCVHLSQKAEDTDVKRIVEELKDCKHVYIGGAEPTIHKDLIELLKSLKEKGIEVTLKTNGYLSKVVEEAMPYVDKFVFEIKGDLDDIKTIAYLTGINEAKAKRYVANLLKSIELTRKNGKKIRLWFRAIPGYIDERTFEKMLRKVGRVDEVLVYQFLARKDWDKPFNNAKKPDYDFVRKLAKIAKNYAQEVILVGEKREVI